ncbi:MAG: hypothetical protein HGA53_08410 [Anaerolineaceae bacterium]|nr:hypothetical protein [Anaerolineaceae bacterium]
MKNRIQLPALSPRLIAIVVIVVGLLLFASLGLPRLFTIAFPSAALENSQERIAATPAIPVEEPLTSSKGQPAAMPELKVAADTVKPVLSWNAPVADGQILEVTGGPVTLTVKATDNNGVARVRFTRWDPEKLVFLELAVDSASPYTLELDTSTLNNGWNQVNAVAYDTAGNSSEFRYIFLYRTIPDPGKLTAISPVGEITTIKPAYVWTPVKGAVKYHLDVFEVDSGKKVLSKDVNSSACSTSKKKCTYTPSTSLSLYKDYQWKVSVINAKSLAGVVSPMQSFKPAIPIPATISPTGNITSTRPAFVWSHIKVAASYRLYIYDVAESKYLLVTTVGSSVCSTSTGQCTYKPSITLTKNKAYSWKIVSLTSSNLYSPHSEPMKFKVKGQ